MSSYFPIPPNIFIKDFECKIYGSTTFLNIPNNRLKKSIFGKPYNSIIYLGLYYLNEKNWILIKVFECNPYEFVEVHRKNLKVYDNQMLLLVPKTIKDFPAKAKELPRPDSLRLDKSPVAERCSLNFHFKKSITSYQGEYPFQMASLKKSSFLSFDGLKQISKDNNLINFLIFMNINTHSESQEEVIIKVFNPENIELKKNIIAKKNAFTIHRIGDENLSGIENKILFYTSDHSSFIPITLSVNLQSNQLSAEHTHPPSKFFAGNKSDVIKLIKNNWI